MLEDLGTLVQPFYLMNSIRKTNSFLTFKREKWFSGHCHVNYSAVWGNEAKTQFSAVDKCIEHREYITVCYLI